MSIDLFTLYRHDRDHATDLPERLHSALDIPSRVASTMCTAYPALWPYIMDFVQEGNIKLIEAHEKCDPAWNLTRFRSYVARCCQGAILQYLSRTFAIYIPPSMRHRMVKERGELAKVEWLEHHVSWDKLFEHMANIPDTRMQQAVNATLKEKIAALLAQLPEKERIAITLYYGIDTHPHTSREIGKLFGVHPDHAKEMVNKAIKRLRGEQVQLPRKEWIEAKRAEYTQCTQGHPVSEENTYTDKRGRRMCKICHRQRVRETYQRKKKEATA
jgi:RNA polymerase sigma factor (sigma-70 family)